ncbi:MAG: hypothetical protein R3F31_15535 [Verrucomicrobiales bacterium]|nr:hypothetical protein [Verrucomicrobiales bacterium]
MKKGIPISRFHFAPMTVRDYTGDVVRGDVDLGDSGTKIGASGELAVDDLLSECGQSQRNQRNESEKKFHFPHSDRRAQQQDRPETTNTPNPETTG